MKTIPAAKFKAECLAILDRLEPDGVLVTKHGRPVARVVPASTGTADLIGALATRLRIRGDVMSTGARWTASRRKRR